MRTIAESLIELQQVKDKLEDRVQTRGKYTKDKSLSALVDEAFEEVIDVDDGIYGPSGFIDLATFEDSGTGSSVSLTNLVTNGDFSNGTTGWTPSATTSFSVVGGVARISPTTSGSNFYIDQVLNVVVGRTYYIRLGKLAQTAPNSMYVYFNGTNNFIISNGAHTDYSGWSAIYIPTGSNGTVFRVGILGGTRLTTDYVEVDDITLIDLTEVFGAGNEPSLSRIEQLLGEVKYFNGSKDFIKPLSKWIETDVSKTGVVYNIIKNGDFSDGTNNWSAMYGTAQVQDNVYKLTGDGNSKTPYVTQNVVDLSGVGIGKKFYLKVLARVTNSSCSRINFYVTGGAQDNIYEIREPKENVWYELRNVITRSSGSTSGIFLVAADYASTLDALGKTLEIKYVLGIDLSAPVTHLAPSSAVAVEKYLELDTLPNKWFATSMVMPVYYGGEIGMVVSNAYDGVIDFTVTTSTGKYKVIKHDGANESVVGVYNGGTTASVNIGVGNGKSYVAVKIVALEGSILRFYVNRSAGLAYAYQNNGITHFYANTSTLNSTYQMFSNTTSIRSVLLEKFYVKSLINCTTTAQMFFHCFSLRVLSGDYTNQSSTMASMFHSCRKLKTVPNTLNVNWSTNFTSMFQYCSSLINLPEVMPLRTDAYIGTSYMFYECTSLKKTPTVLDISMANNTNNMFGYCFSLLEVPTVLDTRNSSSLLNMFGYCTSLRTVQPTFNCAKSTTVEAMFYGCYSLERLPVLENISLVASAANYANSTLCASAEIIDLSTSSPAMSKVTATYATGLRAVLVNPNATTWSGTAPQIELTSCGIGRDALIALFNSLGTVSGKTIKITQCLGTSSLTADDLAIATNKGWTVTTT